jgi:LPXTG-motif cell wall-anchored protein
MGLAGGEPALKAVPSVDASYEVPTTLPETLPETGGEMTSLWLIAAFGAGLALVGGGLLLRKRASQEIVDK